MKRSLIFSFFILSCLFITISGVLGDERSEPKDIIIALDKSLSMDEEIIEVKEFISSEIIERLIKDDFFLLLVFYGRAEVATAKYINDPLIDIPVLKADVEKILANGPFTDIGNVLDRLRDEFYERADNNRKKWCFLVTDGINEPTLTSKYYSLDGKFNHEFLDDLKEIITRNGWKVQFLEIGEGSDAKEIATTLGVDYAKTEEKVTSEDIKEVIADPIGSAMILKDSIEPIIIDQNGDGFLKFKVKSERYKSKPQIIIDNLQLNSSTFMEENILLTGNYPVTLPETGETELKVPIKVKSNVQAGDYQVNLLFSYSSTEKFDENSINATMHKNNIFENYPWLLPILIILAIFLIGIIILIIATIAKGKPVVFKVIVEEAPLPEGKNSFKLTKNKEFFLTESLDIVTLLPKKTGKSIGKLTYLPEGLKLRPLNEFRFENPDSIPENVLGERIQIRTISSKLYNVSFLKIT